MINTFRTKRKCAMVAQKKKQSTSKKVTDEVTFNLGFVRSREFSMLSNRKSICISLQT